MKNKPYVVRNPHKTSVIYYNGKPYKRVYLNETAYDRHNRWAKRFVLLPIICTILLFIFGSLLLKAWDETRGQEVRVERVEVPVVIREVPQILRRIAKCESNDLHEINGKVVLGDGGKSVGRYQINLAVWGQKAHELKYDLYNEIDNEEFALYILDNYGTPPWIASAKCWNA